MSDPNIQLQMLPVQVIEHEDRVILIRGLSQVQIPDKNVLLVLTVLQRALQAGPMSAEALSGLFAAPLRPLVLRFIDFLQQKRFIVEAGSVPASWQPESESSQDIFYWHYNRHQEDIAQRLNEKIWLFAGVNELNKKIVQRLADEGLQQGVIIDDPTLRNTRYFNVDGSLRTATWALPETRIITPEQAGAYATEDIAFIVAGTEFGSQYLLRDWNEYAVKKGIPFFPVLLQHMSGYAGPLVIPGESACLECLRARQNSNAQNFEECRITEQYAFQAQQSAAYHSSMLHMLAEIAMFELVRYSAGISWEVGTMTELNLLSGTMDKRKLLKAPRCPVCSNMHRHPKLNLHKRLATEESWEEINKTVGYHE